MNNVNVKELNRIDDVGWLTRERVLVLALIAATALSLYVCYQLARPFLPALAWALALGIVAHPLYEWIARRISRANIAAAAAVFLVSIVIIAPTVFVVERLVSEGVSGLEMIKEETAADRWQAAIGHNSHVASVLHWIQSHIDLGGGVQSAATAFTAWFSSVVTGSLWSVAELLITLFILFYFFRDHRAILRNLRSLMPLSEAETDQVFSRVTDTVYATVYGTVLVSIVQGALGGLMFWWLGLPSPLLWAVVMALLSIVPVLGPFVIWVPAALLLALEGHWWKAAVLTGWGIGVVGMIDNLLYPIFVGERMQLHTLPVFLAILGGLTMFGASGVILGPVALAFTVALLDVWRRRIAGRQAADAGVELGG